MGKYSKGDHVKIEVADEQFCGMSEWVRMLIAPGDDEKQIVLGRVDNEPVVAENLKLGQQLAASYDKIRDHQKSTDSWTIQE